MQQQPPVLGPLRARQLDDDGTTDGAGDAWKLWPMRPPARVQAPFAHGRRGCLRSTFARRVGSFAQPVPLLLRAAAAVPTARPMNPNEPPSGISSAPSGAASGSQGPQACLKSHVSWISEGCAVAVGFAFRRRGELRWVPRAVGATPG